MTRNTDLPKLSQLMATGIPIVEEPRLLDSKLRIQRRFPRSKKKRIRKKWRNDRRNWVSSDEPQCYLIQGPGGPVLLANKAFMKLVEGIKQRRAS